MTHRVKVDEIDERLIVAAVRKEEIKQVITPPPLEPLGAVVLPETMPDESPPPEPLKEETRNKRTGAQEYESLFVRETDLPRARFGKSVYIRKEYHDRISQIVSVIGGNEVSLFGYIDNVLAHHFENFRDDIARAFKKKLIFK